jgi:hypothetical protein
LSTSITVGTAADAALSLRCGEAGRGALVDDVTLQLGEGNVTRSVGDEDAGHYIAQTWE